MNKSKRVSFIAPHSGIAESDMRPFPDIIKNNKKPDAEVRTIRLEINLSTSQTFAEYSYPDLIRKAKGKLDGEHNDDEDKDKEFLEDFIDKGYGYDETDPFIDNSEAYDELVPSTLSTMYGGFYINTGILEFKDSEQQKTKPSKPQNHRKEKSSNPPLLHSGIKKRPKLPSVHRIKHTSVNQVPQSSKNQTPGIQVHKKQTDSIQVHKKQTDSIQVHKEQADNIQIQKKQTDNIQIQKKQTDNMQIPKKQSDSIQAHKKQADNLQIHKKQADNTHPLAVIAPSAKTINSKAPRALSQPLPSHSSLVQLPIPSNTQQDHEHKITPTLEQKISPVHEQKVNPIHDQNISSVHQQKITPVHKSQPVSHQQNMTSVHQQNITAVHQQNIAAAHQQKISSAHEQIITQVHQQKINPVHQQKISPVHQQKITPAHQLKITPAHQQKITPAHQQKITPAHQHKITSAHKPQPAPQAHFPPPQAHQPQLQHQRTLQFHNSNQWQQRLSELPPPIHHHFCYNPHCTMPQCKQFVRFPPNA